MSSFIVETNKSPITENIPESSDTDLPTVNHTFNMLNINVVISVVIMFVVIFIIYYLSTRKSSNFNKEKINNKNVMEVEVQKLRDFQASLMNTT